MRASGRVNAALAAGDSEDEMVIGALPSPFKAAAISGRSPRLGSRYAFGTIVSTTPPNTTQIARDSISNVGAPKNRPTSIGLAHTSRNTAVPTTAATHRMILVAFAMCTSVANRLPGAASLRPLGVFVTGGLLTIFENQARRCTRKAMTSTPASSVAGTT